MKPIEEKDKPKLFIMIGLFVVVLAVGAFQIFGGGGAPPKPVAATSPKASPTTPVNKSGRTTVANASTTPDAALTAFNDSLEREPVGGRDPFMPSGPAAARPAPPPVPTPTIAPNAPVHPVVNKLDAILNAGEKNLSAMTAGGPERNNTMPSPVGPVTPPPPPPPAFTVSGVVLADASSSSDNIAIVHKGGLKGDDRSFVTVGDYIGNGFKVVAVHADGVDIEDKGGSRRLTVRIGKSGEDSRATN